MARPCTTHHHACDCREAKFAELERDVEEQSRLIEKQAGTIARLEAERDALRKRIEDAPLAGVDADYCGRESFVIESLQKIGYYNGKRVRLVVEDE
jgi:hypothetical protein